MKAGRWLLLSMAACPAWGCAHTVSDWDELGGPGSAEVGIHERVVRYMTTYYRPSADIGTPAAYCLAVPRDAEGATEARNRNGEEVWVPTRTLLGRLGNIEPPVVPASECGRDDRAAVVYGKDREAAIVLLVSRPSFSGPSTATVGISAAESRLRRHFYRCDMTRDGFGWRVVRCLGR